MARNGWHVIREGEAVTLTRALPVVWDVAAETRLGPAARLRLAHLVRQDLWRALAGLRGFAPAVRVAWTGGGAGLVVRAGGRVRGPHDRAAVEARIAGVLASPVQRARWLRSARIREQDCDVSGRAREFGAPASVPGSGAAAGTLELEQAGEGASWTL
jgi:hypothetical protein